MTKQRRQAATTIQASIRRKQATAAAAKRKKAVVAEQNLLLNRKASQIQKLARGRLGKKKVRFFCVILVKHAAVERITTLADSQFQKANGRPKHLAHCSRCVCCKGCANARAEESTC